jgi:16S rRNA (uracil1498-N3)-methyltransferase
VSLAKALDGWDGARVLIFADEAGDALGMLEALQRKRPSPLAGEGRVGGASAKLSNVGADTPSSISSPQGGGEAVPPAKVALLIGPEGGFTLEERGMLRAYAFVVPVSLGPRILRAETAVIAALTLIQAAWGDWREA